MEGVVKEKPKAKRRNAGVSEQSQKVIQKEALSEKKLGESQTTLQQMATEEPAKLELHITSIAPMSHRTTMINPIQPKYMTNEYLRSITHLRTKTNVFEAILRIRHTLMRSIQNIMHQNQFILTTPPTITESDCEGGGQTFKLKQNDYFDKPVYLTVSTQLHLEAMAQSHARVYALEKCFRAEETASSRHLSEFCMLEPEWIDTSLDELMDYSEHLIRRVAADINKDDIVATESSDRVAKFLDRPKWTRISYTDACNLLHIDVGSDLSSKAEMDLVAHFGGPVFVTRYAASLKPFYMLPTAGLQDDIRTVENFDLLFPDVGEVAGGSMRVTDPTSLPAGWYRDLREFGGTGSGGFGLGIDRLLMYLSGQSNIRDVVFAPRTFGAHGCLL